MPNQVGAAHPNAGMYNSAEIVRTENSPFAILVLLAFPYLYELFIEASQGLTKARSSSISAEFALFLEFYRILSELMNRHLNSAGGTFKQYAHRVLAVIMSVLERVQQHDIYRATNDEASRKQRHFFEQLNRTFLELG